MFLAQRSHLANNSQTLSRTPYIAFEKIDPYVTSPSREFSVRDHACGNLKCSSSGLNGVRNVSAVSEFVSCPRFIYERHMSVFMYNGQNLNS